jgi:hypothetical protein
MTTMIYVKATIIILIIIIIIIIIQFFNSILYYFCAESTSKRLITDTAQSRCRYLHYRQTQISIFTINKNWPSRPITDTVQCIYW